MKNSKSTRWAYLLVLVMGFLVSLPVRSAAADTSWQWDFGDGSAASSDQNASHAYAAVGDYSWKLTVTANGQQCVQTGQIRVSPPCVPPDITENPAGQALQYAESAALTIKAAGTELRYQWYEGASGNINNPLNSQTDALTTWPLAHSSLFWVRVSNSCGQADSLAASVTVAPQCQVPSILEQPRSKTVFPNDKAALRVSATGTDLNYQWYEGALGNTKKPVGDNSPDFKTPRLKAAAQYWVIVSNGCGIRNSVGVKINVSPVAPRIGSVSSRTSHPGSGAVIRGRNFSAETRFIKVRFGSLQARVKRAAPRRLRVIIPKEAQTGSLRVAVQVNKLWSNTRRFFIQP